MGFDPLVRGVSGTGSTGLGLDIVRKTASAVGGRVETSDRPGGGAVVRVVLG
jgi:signal transduction histidine kinase